MVKTQAYWEQSPMLLQMILALQRLPQQVRQWRRRRQNIQTLNLLCQSLPHRHNQKKNPSPILFPQLHQQRMHGMVRIQRY